MGTRARRLGSGGHGIRRFNGKTAFCPSRRSLSADQVMQLQLQPADPDTLKHAHLAKGRRGSLRLAKGGRGFIPGQRENRSCVGRLKAGHELVVL